MHAYLIVGGDKQTRAEKLEEILAQRERFNLGGGQKGDSSLKIEDVREAETWVNLKRHRPAALVVDQADKLTLPAQHAFLKTLEEPGDNILIVLTAADTSGLLATVRSRCQIIRLPSAAAESAGVEKFRKLLNGSAAERLGQLYPILQEITGSAASIHRGAIKRDQAIMFMESFIGGLSLRGALASGNPQETALMLKSAVSAHRRLKNNLNVQLALQQFILDI